VGGLEDRNFDLAVYVRVYVRWRPRPLPNYGRLTVPRNAMDAMLDVESLALVASWLNGGL
jgi:hypothetical protein